MKVSSKWWCGVGFAAIVSSGFLSVSCGSADWDAETSSSAAEASVSTQKEFAEYWAEQRKRKGDDSAPQRSDEAEKEEATGRVEAPGSQKKEEMRGGQLASSTESLEGVDLSGDFPTAAKIEGREGFVRSPYNQKAVNVRGVESGLLVADPRFDLSERKFFIVP
ncbi:MAG: hypothetical protein ACQKBU_01015 [Verrucomicrobiales bacterium]